MFWCYYESFWKLQLKCRHLIYALWIFFNGLNWFLWKTNIFFVIAIHKRFQIVISLTVALISLFLCWTPPPPSLALFLPHKTSFNTRQLHQTQRSSLWLWLSHSKGNTEVSLSGKWIKLFQLPIHPQARKGWHQSCETLLMLSGVRTIYSKEGVGAFGLKWRILIYFNIT